jgi:hypothetical protein
MIGGETKMKRQVARANSSAVAKHCIEYNNIIQIAIYHSIQPSNAGGPLTARMRRIASLEEILIS